MKNEKESIEQELLEQNEQLKTDLQRFRCMTDGAPVILWMTDNEGRSHYFNRQWGKFTGVKDMGSLNGRTWFNSLHPEDRKSCLSIVGDAFERRAPIEMVYRLRRYDGEYRWMLDNGMPHYNDEGEFLGYVGASIDITERREAEEGLKRSHEELAQNNRNIALISKMNDQLQVCIDHDEVQSVLSHYVPNIFSENSAGKVCLMNEDHSLLEIAVSWGKATTFEDVFNPEDCWALRQGKAHIINGPGQDVKCRHLTKIPGNGCICVPMIAHGEVLGLLHLQYPAGGFDDRVGDEQRFLQTQERLAMTMAENLALALSSFRLREALRRQSVRDPLTQLFNRRYMIEMLEQSLHRAKRHNQDLGVLMIDLDYFKQFNDQYGHPAGDAVLRELAQFLKTNVRAEDVVCRYGGEEFTIVMPDAPPDIVVRRAQDLCKEANGLSLKFYDQALPNITLSIGVSFFPSDGDSVDGVLKIADRRLYQAKANGRNQVVNTTAE